MKEQKCTIGELIKEFNKIANENGYGSVAKVIFFTPANETISYVFDFNPNRL